MEKYKGLSTKQISELQSVVNNKHRQGDEVRRAQAILLLDRGIESSEILEITGLGRAQVFDLRKKYYEQGIDVVVDKRKGKPKEILTKSQREEILETIKTKTPKSLGVYYGSYEFWTTGLLGDWIVRKYQVQYKSKTSYQLIFRKAEFTYHKPGRVYHERDKKEVERWKKMTKPKVRKLWGEKDTVLLVEDEMILTTRTTVQKIWLPQGEYPKIEVSNGTVQRRNVYGFLNMKTGDEHAFKTEKQNMHVTKEIFEKIRVMYPEQKIALFMDNAGWHRGSVVKKFIEQDGNMVVIHFPKYAPEENPQEHVWKNGRSKCTHNKFIENIDRATDEFVEYLCKTKFPYSLLGFSPVS
jgi:transposase